MSRRAQLIPWRTAGEASERQATGDDVVRATGWVFNNEPGSDLAHFVATGDQEVPAYLTVFGLRSADNEQQTLVEIGSGIGRMTCAFTREYGTVIACDLDAGFLERTHETVGRFGRVDRLQTSHVVDGQTLDLPDDSADVAFSYITLQHCDDDDALDLTAEAVRITRPGGKIALNYRGRSTADVVLLPLGSLMRAAFRIPGIGPWLARRRASARLGWQANRLHPDQIIGPLANRLTDIELWRHPKSKITAFGATTHEFDGINASHYWVVATRADSPPRGVA